MNQLDLFAPRDQNVATADVKRLAGQNGAILSRLRRGPATNVELAGIALKYSSRNSDLRKFGYDVRCRRIADGLFEYWLEGEPH